MFDRFFVVDASLKYMMRHKVLLRTRLYLHPRNMTWSSGGEEEDPYFETHEKAGQLRRDRRTLEQDEFLVRIGVGAKVVPGRLRKIALDRDVDPDQLRIAEDEYIDEMLELRDGWAKRNQRERFTPGAPIKFLLKDDEFVDDTGRLRIVGYGADRPADNSEGPMGVFRWSLKDDEYIDEFGVVR